MTPISVVFILFPIGVLILTVLLKAVLRFSKKVNIMIALVTYLLTNIGLYLLIKGAFISQAFDLAKELQVFMNLRLRQWIDILLIPNTFTFMYLAISLITLRVMDRLMIKIQDI
ncbi:hypothetical protein SM124_00200 [Bacillus sp. 31A1R]|uniref:Uncharacterized protein n=1 Tax=Robertmurraya mangrovi TaxID=3098077 RepID=A0ABU5ISN4_9BACI|nr:hypothetical protein [Bacillus sp. 31A1R]MDZ5470155.1 hypothetical protein [Bacillus sp. 31A1R]